MKIIAAAERYSLRCHTDDDLGELVDFATRLLTDPEARAAIERIAKVESGEPLAAVYVGCSFPTSWTWFTDDQELVCKKLLSALATE